MYRLKIEYYKPRFTGVTMVELEEQEDVLTKVTVTTDSSLRRGHKNIPVMPKLHAKALVELAKFKDAGALRMAVYLGLHLGRKNPETVTLTVSKVMEELCLSENTILKHIKILEGLKYIKNIGKSMYYISPSLAFYGTAIEWSLALQIEADGGTLEEFRVAKTSVLKQISANMNIASINPQP